MDAPLILALAQAWLRERGDLPVEAAWASGRALGLRWAWRKTAEGWVLLLHPQPELMTEAPWSFQAHAVVAMVLFAVIPFTRLVHIFSAPLGYVTRPYLVYRSRDPEGSARAPRRGWEPVRHK